jgi:small subunit ribosomal protein S17
MKRTIKATVVSDSNDTTIVVSETRKITHPVYRKQYPVSKKFHAHDPKNEAGVGDEVVIEEMTPMSKNKRWKLVEITKKAVGSTSKDAA